MSKPLLFQSGVTVFVIGVGNAVNIVEMAGIATPSTGSRMYYYQLADFNALAGFAGDIVNATCNVVPGNIVQHGYL